MKILPSKPYPTGLSDSANGKDVPTLKVCDITDELDARKFSSFTKSVLLIYGRAQRGLLCQIVHLGKKKDGFMRIHFFIGDLSYWMDRVNPHDDTFDLHAGLIGLTKAELAQKITSYQP